MQDDQVQLLLLLLLLGCVLVQVVTETELRPVWQGNDSTQGISELDYSPDGKLLAAATFDAWIDIYNVEKGYQRIGGWMHFKNCCKALAKHNESAAYDLAAVWCKMQHTNIMYSVHYKRAC
jgi:WD40 repeat protein